MIPYFQFIQFHIGPIPINIWGSMVALGIIVGLTVSSKEAKRRGLDVQVFLDMAFWSLFAALIGSRVLYVVTQWEFYSEDFLGVFRIWEGGMAITGGFFGAVLAGYLFLKKKKLNILQYVDVAIFGLPVGLFIGRIGCFLIYDHPGIATNFFLGQKAIDGIIRHNHGLYLSINGFILAVVFFILWKKNSDRPDGFYPAVFLIWYGMIRFILDFFRAYELAGFTDSRLLGLTTAQYIAVIMFVGGLTLWYSVVRKNLQEHAKREKTKNNT